MKPRIFISHSAKDREVAPVDPRDAEAVRRREILTYTRLARREIVFALTSVRDDAGEQRFDVWLDQEVLAGGDEWSQELQHALQTCDAAVILLDSVSMRSGWVHHEATVMVNRAANNPRLTVVPVFLGELRSAALDEPFWKQTGLGAVHPARLASDELNEHNAVQLAKLVAGSFCHLTREDADTPMGRWVEHVGEVVERASAASRKRAARELGIAEQEWDALSAGHITLAHRLLHSTIDQARGPLTVLLKGMDSDSGTRLIKRVLPIWVHVEAGSRLSSALEAAAPQLLIVNVKALESGWEYLRRAHFGELETWQVVEAVNNTGPDIAEVLVDIDQALRAALLDDPKDTFQHEFDDDDVLVLVGPNAARADVAQTLHARYPRARFIVLSGDDHGVARAQLPQALLIEPPATEERVARKTHRTLLQATVS